MHFCNVLHALPRPLEEVFVMLFLKSFEEAKRAHEGKRTDCEDQFQELCASSSC